MLESANARRLARRARRRTTRGGGGGGGVSSCFCCSPHSRAVSDAAVERQVLPLAPASEWDLPWDVNALPPETGSRDIASFFVLRRIFLFLPFHLDTLLAVAGACRAWRVVADRLPHWRYLLPMRNEVAPIVGVMRWHEPPLVERVPLVNRRNGSLTGHYRLRFRDDAIDRLSGRDAYAHCCSSASALCQCLGRVRAACCGCDGCDDACSCSSDEDVFEDGALRAEKAAEFVRTSNDGGMLLRSRRPDDVEHSAVAVRPVAANQVVNWIARLRRVGGGGAGGGAAAQASAMTSHHHATAHDVFADAEGAPGARRSAADAARRTARDAPAQEMMSRVGPMRRVGNDDDDDADSNSSVDSSDDDGNDPAAELEMFTEQHSGVVGGGSDDDDADAAAANVAAAAAPARPPRRNGAAAHARQRARHRRGRSVAGEGSGDAGEEPVSLGDGHEPLPHQVTPITAQGASRYIDNYGSHWQSTRCRHVRVAHQTLTSKSVAIMASGPYRQNWMFFSLSSFLHAARLHMDRHQREATVTCCDRYGSVLSITLVCFAWLVVCLTLGGLCGLFVDKTVFETPTDVFVGRTVALCVYTISLFAMVYILVWSSALYEELPAIRPASIGKAGVVVVLTYTLISLSVPLSLATSRVNAATRLLADGVVSACDAWSTLPSAAAAVGPKYDFVPVATNRNGSQCVLPPSMLPSRLARSAFLEFPPGTTIMYHPPGVSRAVPYSATRTPGAPSPATANECRVARDAAVSNTDLGANMSRYDVARGHVGYYTVFLAPSCSGAAAPGRIDNVTVLIAGDYAGCPFWSTSPGAVTTTADVDGVLHPFFRGVLASNAATDAIGNASLISAELAAAISSAGQQPSLACGAANNSMVTIRGGPGVHRFYLRVARGFQPHWTASYYHPRQPYDPKQGGPWAARPKWTDTLDYQLNGIVALMADANIFLAHERTGTIDPVAISPFVGDFDDETGTTPFWTAASPAGLRRLRDDYVRGSLVVVGFAVGSFVVLGFTNIFAWGRVRWTVACAVYAMLILLAVPLPLLIYSAVCFAKAGVNDANELAMPMACLSANRTDAQGSLILSAVVLGMFVLSICASFWADACDDDDD